MRHWTENLKCEVERPKGQQSVASLPEHASEVEGYFTSPEDAPPKYLLMMRLYIDESGHEGRGWVCVAGFVGHESQWRAFVPKWKEALGPQRKCLHMNDLCWKKDSTRRLLAKLGPIPNSCGLMGARGVVRVADYDDLVTGTPDQQLFKGYLACLLPMVTQVLKGISADERLEIVFEEQWEYAPWIAIAMQCFTTPDRSYYRQTNNGKPKLAKWGFVPKCSTIMSDPADYLAFALREMHMERKSKKSEWCKPILG